MRQLCQLLTLLLVVLLAAFSGVAVADDDDDDEPAVIVLGSQPDSTGALLRAKVDPSNHATTVVFAYGTTTAYGNVTPAATVSRSASWETVSARLEGLEPATTYHFRVEATNSKGTTRSWDRTFTTLAADAPSTDPPPAGDDAVEPDLGASVVVAPRGRVRIRRPGSSSFMPLAADAELAAGTVVDAHDGQVALTAALPSGATQTGRFGGGRFVIRQSRRGLVNLHLRGRACARRASSGSAVTAAKRGRRSGRRLWGRDRGGRFRTHGRHSHATVRGTRWVVVDRCDGATVTRVSEGSVVVRDRVRRESVVVHAGERYVARPRR